MADALHSQLDPVEVLQNEIPADWKNYNQFKGRQTDIIGTKIKLIPHIGAFEVWHEGFLLFSKLSSRVWPSCKTVAAKIKAFIQDKKNKVADLSKYNINYQHPSSMGITFHKFIHCRKGNNAEKIVACANENF